MGPKSQPLVWDTLSRQEQDLCLTLLWKDGYSERAIAQFLNTTKGRIVRRRATIKLLNEQRSPPFKVRGTVNPDRFLDLLELHQMRETGVEQDPLPS
jgi:hypothetical protein